MSTNLNPGFLAIHGNQLEQLRDAVFGWLRNNPLGPLETEIILVQSNGVAEWLKIALAEEMGICCATSVRLPGRFLWEAYRGMLGAHAIARRSALDKSTLTWRLMRLLPTLLDQPQFEPLQRFLADGDPERRLQLAERLSDLFDQYQVYRADWLGDWERGRDVLRTANGEALAMTHEQLWQAQLWRVIRASLPNEEQGGARADVHRQFVAAAESGAPARGILPRRVVVFGVSALPYQTLQALGALATRMQVVIAVPNPCRYYWGDIIEGRDLLHAKRHRQAPRDGIDLGEISLEALHVHSHPLLAGWGRMGRDFIRMLDEFDNEQSTRAGFPNLRIDLFSEGDGSHLLGQVQAAIRDMLPLGEHPHDKLALSDHSIAFHVAHSVQREVEILHDQLLSLFARPQAQPLRPRDVVVMVPDIEAFSPAIRAVFGQTGRHDERHIPFEIADAAERQINPLLVALEWLLRLPQQRCLQGEVRDLLDVPALAARFGLKEIDLPRLGQWITGAGVRWGLDGAHRDCLGLGAAGEQNGWLFGIHRMLLGYASGAEGSYQGIEPYGEIGGLDAALAGSLADLVAKLLHWRLRLAEPATPTEWVERARLLLAAFFRSSDEAERLTLARLEQALQGWLEDCDMGQFKEVMPLAVLREAWLGAIDAPLLDRHFVSGGVTFCTLMPMRAVPFRVVCLLGMNDGDYPRRAQHADFDLLALRGLARPGDRSRRDDDRYLMLEAVLAARDHLLISWVGRNVRDNSEQPPSVLVSQLRDYLAAGWDLTLAQLTTEHPLQPFSRRYFTSGPLLTYASEWLAAHQEGETEGAGPVPPLVAQVKMTLTQQALASFIRRPVKHFFRERLAVVFAQGELIAQDDEPFGLNGLEEYDVAGRLLDDSGAQELMHEVASRLRQRAAGIGREGVLPIGLMGQRLQEDLVDMLVPLRTSWLTLCARYPIRSNKLSLSFAHGAVELEDWIDQLRSDGDCSIWLDYDPGNVMTKDKIPMPRGDKLTRAWVRQLCAAAMGHALTGYLVARDAVLVMEPLDPALARATLCALLDCWQDGTNRPLPTACKTALAFLAGGKANKAYDGDDFSPIEGEGKEPCLARLWEDFTTLCAEPDWETCTRTLYGPLHEWMKSDVRIVTHDTLTMEGEAA